MPKREPLKKGHPKYWITRAQASWSGDIGLPKADRLDFAGQMLRRDVHSWSSLSDKELEALVYVMRGVHIVDELRRQRGHREAS